MEVLTMQMKMISVRVSEDLLTEVKKLETKLQKLKHPLVRGVAKKRSAILREIFRLGLNELKIAPLGRCVKCSLPFSKKRPVYVTACILGRETKTCRACVERVDENIS
jgi:hypothetical protein